MTLGVPNNLLGLDDTLSATDEVLLPYVLAAEQGGTVFCTSANAPTVELVPFDVRGEFEETLDCLRQLERVRRDFGGQGASEPPPVAWDSVPSRSGQSSIASRSGQSPNLHLGKFEIVRELGRGGFAIVYLARDIRLRRDVALKIPRPDVLLSPEMRDRFAREARAAAALDHPNIVPVLEVGNDDLQCWIAYAHCEGPTLAQWLASRGEPVHARDAAQLVAQLADAVQHAHSRGILHRDIKPSNVLLEKVEDRELRVENSETRHSESWRLTFNPQSSILDYRVRLIDFGLAKVFDDGEPETRTGVVIGTADYMAPEQARGDNKEVSAATDVFALGTILYELLAGQPPFRGTTTHETLLRLQNEEPTRLSVVWHDAPRRESRHGASRHTRVPNDLETICLKCLEKDTQQRYTSAAALADDLQHFLAGEPIQARPAGSWERLGKWARRKPVAATAVGLLGVLLISLAGLIWQHSLELRESNRQLKAAVARQQDEARVAKEQRQLADARAKRIRQHVYADNLRLAQQFIEGGQSEVAVRLLNRVRPEPDEDDLRSFEWHYWWERCHEKIFPLVGHSGSVYAVAYSLDGRQLLSGSSDRTARIWDVEAGRELFRLQHPHEVRCVAFSPDGQVCVTGARDAVVRMWDATSGRLLHSLTDHSKDIRAISFSRNGELLVTADQPGNIRVRNAMNGEVRQRLKISPHVAHGGMMFSADQKTLVVGEEWGFSTWHFDLSTKSEVPREVRFDGVVRNLCSSGSGERVFVGHDNGKIQILNLIPEPNVERDLLERTPQHPPGFYSLACSPDDRELVSIGKDGSAKHWQLSSLTSRDLLLKPVEKALCAAFSPDRKTLVLGGSEGMLRICPRIPPLTSVPGHAREAWAVAFSPDDRWLASGSDDGTAAIWDMSTGAKAFSLNGHVATVTGVVFSPDGKTLATSSLDRTVKLWNVESGQPLMTLTGHTERVRSVTYSPDGRWLASGGYEGLVLLWDGKTGELRKTLTGDGRRIRDVSFSPDGKILAAGSLSGQVLFWDVESGQSQIGLGNDRQEIWSACFSPDGRQFLTGDEQGVVKLWDLESRQPLFTQQAHANGAMSVLFTPDGKRFISAGRDQTIKLWDRATGQELTTLRGHQADIYGIAIAHDGQTLASCSYDGAVKIWRGPSSSR